LRDLQKLESYLPTVLLTKRTILILLKDSVTLERAVIKPAFSAGSYLTEVFDVSKFKQSMKVYISIAAEKESCRNSPEIQTIGETSYLFDKKFSHAVNKTR
jgi:hypothetical protein